MTTTPTTDVRPIAAVAREADIDLRVLASRPPVNVPPSVQSVTPEISKAVTRYREIVKARGEAARAVRSALSAVVSARADHERSITQAVLNDKREPKAPDVSEHISNAREQYRRVRALSRAEQTAQMEMLADLADAREALAELRRREQEAAREAIEIYQSVDAVLTRFAQQRAEAHWLEGLISRAERGLGTTHTNNGIKPVVATIDEAHQSLAEEVLDRE
jgi:hypothetical protein